MKDLEYLSKDQLRAKVPLAFAEGPTREVSSKYVFANTETVIDDMATLGWYPVDGGQRKARANSTTEYSPHMVKFANKDVVIEGKNDDISYPQVIVSNRHDGLGAFGFMAGMFRLVCSNGLVIATAEFASLKVAHKGYTFDELREVVGKRVEALPQQVEVMNQMKEVELEPHQKRTLALDGLLLRSGIKPTSEAVKDFQYDGHVIDDILTPVRKMDEGNDLWSVFNVVQEKMVGGGFRANKRVIRGINSFEKDLDLNKKLFSRAMELIPA